MENSAPSFVHNPNSATDSSTSVNNLQLLFANFGMPNNARFQLETDGSATSLRVNPPPPPPGFGPVPRARQVPEHYHGLLDSNGNHNTALRVPVYPPQQSIWAVDAGNSHAGSSNPIPFSVFNYMDNTQQINYVKEAITQEGSLRLQKLLSPDQADPGIVDEIFSGIIGSILTVMNNQHGSYVVSKLIPLLDENQAAMFVQKLSQHNGKPIVDASFNNSGSHSLQKLMKLLVRYNLTVPVVATLAGEFSLLMKDGCAHKVVVKCVEVVPAEQSEPLYRACMEHCLELATHKTGCPSLNHFVEHVKGPLRLELLHRIADHTVFLSQDPTGNHALQRIIHLEDPRITQKICQKLRGEYGLLALQKAGSYVVEKCLNSSGWVYALDDLLLDEAQLLRIAKDRHGNYVVKKALQVSKFRSFAHHYLKLVKKLNNNLSQLQSGYGKNVLLEMANLNLTTNSMFY